MLTQEQLDQRRDFIGASDVAAICGENRYRSIVDVWLEKVHGITTGKTSEAAELGDVLEDACRTLASRALKRPVHGTDLFRELAGTRIGVNLDGWTEIEGATIPVECKTAGLLNEWTDEMLLWGEDWSDLVPPQYLIQVTVQAMAVGSEFGYVSALLGGRGHAMFRINVNPDLVAAILEACDRFWALVESKTRPETEATASFDVLSRIRRVPGTVRALEPDAAEEIIAWQRAVADRKRAEQIEVAAKARVVERLGEAEAGLIEWTREQAEALAEACEIDDLDKAFKRVAVTYMSQSRTDVDRDVLRARFPEIWEQVARTSTYRVLRLGNAKPGVAVNM